MNAVALLTDAVERLTLPDFVTRRGISLLVGRSGRNLGHAPAGADAAFARGMAAYPIAIHADAANQQHYELPPEFFAHILGPNRKYSSCLYASATSTLAEAEELALRETAAHAALADGQHILELGCGWGSLSLWMARRYPNARITALSNAAPQREFIEARAAALGLANLTVVTADMNEFTTAERFDRIVSVEMFEHLSNWTAALTRTRGWLAVDGRLFLHVFTHRAVPYRFDHLDKADWIARHFFTGGIMPSHGLIRALDVPFRVEAEWRWSGTNYQRTALAWLANFDANAAAIDTILRDVYGDGAALWRRRWRLFFLATAGLFGHDGGATWGISHYRLAPA